MISPFHRTQVMTENDMQTQQPGTLGSFYDRPDVQVEQIPIGPGVPLGIARVSNPAVGIGGAYGTWGSCVDNDTLRLALEDYLGDALSDNERLNLAELGFVARHHVPSLSDEELAEVEVAAGARFL